MTTTPKKRITTQSAKAKGRRLQQDVVKMMLKLDPDLQKDDVTSRSMGAGGEDVLLSPQARMTYPISVECKAKSKFAGYTIMDQAKENCPKNMEPVAIVRADRKKALAMVDAEYFLELLSYIRKLEEKI